MLNLQLIEDQPRWRVRIVALFAKLMGVCIHVEGIPFSSNRSRIKRPTETMGTAPGALGTQDKGLPTAEEVRGILKSY